MKTNNASEGKTSKGRRRSNGYRRPNSSKSGKTRRDNENFSKSESMASGDINNPAYYYEDANVLSQVMNFSFNQFGGVPIDMMSQVGNNQKLQNQNVAAYHVNPSVPVTNGVSGVIQGVTTAALRNFIMLSGSNAKTTSYAPQDVVILELALAEVIKVSTFCARAFGVAYLFNYRNRNYPEILLTAMGIDTNDFRRNLAQYRIRFNTLMTLASKIPFPAAIPLFSKAADLFGSIYLDDEDSALAQTYLFVPHSVWKFDEAYDPNGSGLHTVSFVDYTTVQTMDYYLSILESMLYELLNSTTLNYIYSDIMRLVQSGKMTQLITFTSIPEDFNVIPVYNKEVETWLHNSVLLGTPIATANHYDPNSRNYTNYNDVSSDAASNTIHYWPQFEVELRNMGYEFLVDFDHDNVTVEEKVRATRFSQRYRTIYDPNNGNKPYTDEIALCDEYLTGVTFYDGFTSPAYYETNMLFDDNTRYGAQVLQIAQYSRFDWSPLLYWTNNASQCTCIGDIDYYTLVNYHLVEPIYDYEIIHFLQIG